MMKPLYPWGLNLALLTEHLFEKKHIKNCAENNLIGGTKSV
jgi:hypothetical protein